MDEDDYYKENVLSILLGGEGCREKYSSVSEFKHQLKEGGLIEKGINYGWVFGRDGQELDEYANNKHKITALLKNISSSSWFWSSGLVQFWAAMDHGHGHHYLSTSNQPFFVYRLTKGACWYRNVCVEADAEQVGSIGRAYRNKQPESTRDLRLYSTTEFPLRDLAARCGFRSYMALPLFDLHYPHQCLGVLEILSFSYLVVLTDLVSSLGRGLEMVGLRSTHVPLYCDLINVQQQQQQQQVESEITEILELGVKAIPQLSLAQVWVPCKRCHNSRCLELASYVNSHDERLYEYVEACMFHSLQIDVSRLGQDLYDVSISKNPLAHYAERARLSHGFAIRLQSANNNNSNNHFYVMEFFLQPKYRDGDSSLHLLFNILEMKLKSFKFTVLGGKLLEEFVVQSRHPPTAFELESIDMLKAMDSCMEDVSESNFTKFLETDEICFGLFFFNDCDEISISGWVFSSEIEEKSDKNDVNNHSLLIKKKIQHFMKGIASNFGRSYHMVQFWAPGMVENRRCLKTLDQPYALKRLTKGVASFRNKCIEHHYFVDEEAREDELGPVGRVFRNGYPELIHDIFSYSTKEFSMRNYAIHCGIEKYFALPVFDERQQSNQHNCVGVLEFIGFHSYAWNEYYEDLVDEDLTVISRALEGAELCWDIYSHLEPKIVHYKEEEDEIYNALNLISMIPQCCRAIGWVHNRECMTSNSKCMKCLYDKTYEFIHVEPRIGMIGVVLESESKSCFCPNVWELGQSPLSYERKLRHACFAICLQSSRTRNLLYVLECFLNRVPTKSEYLMSFFNFLLPVLKNELKSFKIASGKQVGEGDLLVEVIEFSETNHLISSYSDHPGGLPVKFKTVLCSQKECQHIEEQQVQSNPEVGRGKQDNVVASNVKKIGKGKRKTSLHLSLEILKPHFGKKLEDVAEELGVGRSTIKRACRDYGINRWPGNKKQASNPSLFETGSIQAHIQPSSSNNLDASLQQHAITESTQDEIEKVMIKVRYQGDVIRFESCLPLGVVKLHEEAGRRLKLKMGSFKLKYMDEDNEEILIACDEDLLLCPKTGTSTGKTCIQLFVPK